jgi:hypothetical protein
MNNIPTSQSLGNQAPVGTSGNIIDVVEEENSEDGGETKPKSIFKKKRVDS